MALQSGPATATLVGYLLAVALMTNMTSAEAWSTAHGAKDEVSLPKLICSEVVLQFQFLKFSGYWRLFTLCKQKQWPDLPGPVMFHSPHRGPRHMATCKDGQCEFVISIIHTFKTYILTCNILPTTFCMASVLHILCALCCRLYIAKPHILAL